VNFHPLQAPEFIIHSAREHQNLRLLSVGPLTNVAVALKGDPNLSERLEEIILMGGGYSEFNNRREHNFRSDPLAAEIVLLSGVPIRMVGHNITSRCRFSAKELDQMTQVPREISLTLRRLTQEYLRIMERNYTRLNDPLAAAAVILPSVIKFENREIYVNRRGTTNLVSKLKTHPPWSAHVKVGENVLVRDFKGFLKPVLEEFFQSLPR